MRNRVLAAFLPSFRRDRRGIRFQLSTLLLLSTLNAIAMAAAGILLMRATLLGPTSADTAIREAINRVTDVQNKILLTVATRSDTISPPSNPHAILDQVHEELAALGPVVEPAITHLQAYRQQVERWGQYLFEQMGVDDWASTDPQAGTNGALEPPPGRPQEGIGAAPGAGDTLGAADSRPDTDPSLSRPDTDPSLSRPDTDPSLSSPGGSSRDIPAASASRPWDEASPDPRPGQSGSSDDSPRPMMAGIALDARGQLLLDGLDRTFRRLLGELALAGNEVRPRWVDQMVPVVPWVMAYVLGVALVTVYMAFGLRKRLTGPLERLRMAASDVADGNLKAELPQPAGAFEIRELTRCVDAMQERLLTSIDGLDARTNELTSILDSLSDGVLVLNGEGVITEVNPRATEVLLGRDVPARLPDKGLQFREVVPELGERAPRELCGEVHAVSFTLSSGKIRYLKIRVVPVLGRESAGDVVVVLRDVSHEQQVEEMKREFLSVVTHELKTPLTSIEGYTRLLEMGKGGSLTEKQQMFVETIVDQTLALKEMIQNLLDITRLEGHKLPINVARVNAYDEVRTAGHSISGSAQARGLEVEVALPENETSWIRVDPFRLQQVLGNLLSNALKFTTRGGKISLQAWEKDGEAHITVSDTGRGIPPEALPHLFDKFYQVARGDTRLAGGAGLGLFICKQLVEAQGGRIEVESVVGEGSRFVLSFAVARDYSKGGVEAELS